MPARNAEMTIRAAVESALGQAGVVLEVIIVDDGSTDETFSIITGMARHDDRIEVLRNERSIGVSAARNMAICRAGGEWLVLLDSDDIMFGGRLERLAQLSRAHNLDLAADNIRLVSNNAYNGVDAFTARQMALGELFTLDDLIQGDMPGEYPFGIGYCKPIMRRAFLERNGLRYNNRVTGAEDLLLYAQALIVGGRMMFDDFAGYRYQLREGGHGFDFHYQASNVNRIICGQLRRTRDPRLAKALLRQRRLDLDNFKKAVGSRNFREVLTSGLRAHPSDLIAYARGKLVSFLS